MIVLETPAFQEEIEIYKSEILVAHKKKDRITSAADISGAWTGMATAAAGR